MNINVNTLRLTACVLHGLSVLGGAYAKPPTMDPTYGLPLPPPRAPGPAIPAAQWVWAAHPTDNQSISLRATLDLDQVPKAATLSVTADDFFTLFINGKSVDQSVPDPNDENVWQHVHRLDVARLLVVGKNVIAVRARNAKGAAGVLVQLEADGKALLLTGSAWKVSEGTPSTDSWLTPMFDDSAWQPATEIAAVSGGPWGTNLDGWPGLDETAPYLAHLSLRPLRAEVLPGRGTVQGAETLTGTGPARLAVDPSPPGEANAGGVLLDFGREVAGRVQITGPLGAQVQVGTGESRAECLNQPWNGPHLLTLGGSSPAATPYSAFRYARLTFFGTTPYTLTGVTLDDKYYPVQYKGSFACSDPLLTKIWYTGAYTAHLCMQEDIWDAPKRDRARWVGDLHISGEVINNVFADKFLMEQTLRRLRTDDSHGGDVNGIPGYSAAWFCALADFQRHIGDQAFLASQHDAILSLLEYQRAGFDVGHLFANAHHAWPFVDWSPDFSGDTPQARAATDLFIIKGVHEAVFLLDELGDTVNAAKYRAWADTLTVAARQSLPDPQAHTYGAERQENAMAVYSGVATPKEQAALYAAVLRPGSAAWDDTAVHVATPYYDNYVLFALGMTGHTEDGLNLLRTYWGGMLAEGATTWWEAYDPHWPKADYHATLYADETVGYRTSLCHGWSAGPTNWLTEDVLGVTCTSSGFQTARIVPHLGDLKWAEGDVPTPRGLLRVRVDKTATGQRMRVTIPIGVTAQVGSGGAHPVVLSHAGTYIVETVPR